MDPEAIGGFIVGASVTGVVVNYLIDDILRARRVRRNMYEMQYGNGLLSTGVRLSEEAAFGIYDNFVTATPIHYFTMREVKKIKRERGID